MLVEENQINYKRIAYKYVIRNSKVNTFHLELLIRRRLFNPDTLYSNDNTLLHISILKTNFLMFKMLLSLPSINKNIRNSIGETPLFLATKLGLKYFVVEILKYNDVDIELENFSGLTPHQISYINEYDIIYNLISQKKINISEDSLHRTELTSTADINSSDSVNNYVYETPVITRRRAIRVLNSPIQSFSRRAIRILNSDVRDTSIQKSPLVHSVIDNLCSLPTHFAIKHKELIISCKESCKICLEEFNKIDNIQILNTCYHELCISCYDNILRTNKCCPFCREKIIL